MMRTATHVGRGAVVVDEFGDSTSSIEITPNMLPTVSLNTTSDLDMLKDAQCTICLEDYEIGNSLKTLPCAHFFHTGCVDPWLVNHNACPLCNDRTIVRGQSGPQTAEEIGEPTLMPTFVMLKITRILAE